MAYKKKKRSTVKKTVEETKKSCTITKQVSSSSLNSNNGINIECTVCFEIPKEKGKINCCEHIFCFDCIQTWSEINNNCPYCNLQFKSIEKVQGPPTRRGGRPKKCTVYDVIQKDHRPNMYGSGRLAAAVATRTFEEQPTTIDSEDAALNEAIQRSLMSV